MTLRPHELVDRSRAAVGDQRERLRDELHEVVDLLIDTEQALRDQVRDYSGEMPSGGEGASAGGDSGSSTERKALSPADVMELVDQAKEALAHRLEAVAHLKVLKVQIRKCIPIPPVATGGEVGCRSCARLKDSRGRPTFSPVHRDGSQWCRWCYDFQLEYKCDPPVVLLEARSRGQRISDRMTREALAVERSHPRRRAR